MPSYNILCDGDVIGTSELEDRDDSMGTAIGAFVPTAAYARVQPVFLLFIEARADGESEPVPGKLAAYEAARAELVLSVENAAGKRLEKAGVAILDYSAQEKDAYDVEVYFPTPAYFAQLE